MRFRPAALFLFVALAAIGACGGSSPNPIAPVAAPGFSTVDLTVGTGNAVASGNTISVFYTLWLYNAITSDHHGTQIETNVGGTAYPIVVGSGQVIKGVDQGLVGMRVGGLRRIVVPPDLGYGNTAVQSVPANSTLVFEISLVSIQ